jgi:hypothetical protein
MLTDENDSKCPSFESPSKKRFQWFLERGEEPQGDNGQPAWTESMYWDCLFLSDLYQTPVTSALSNGPSDLDPFADLARAIQDVQRFLNDLANQANAVQSWVK